MRSLNQGLRTLALLGLAGIPLFGLASPARAASDLEKVSLGEYWYGPKLDLESLKGRVVLLEFWGIN